jgi:hypothetical protein
LFRTLFGFVLDAGGVYITSQLEVAFLKLGIILWLAENDPGSRSLRAIQIGLLVGNILGKVVSFVGQLTESVIALAV